MSPLDGAAGGPGRIENNNKQSSSSNSSATSSNKKIKQSERITNGILTQKFHEYGGFLAEAVIVGGKPYFAVASPTVENPEEVSIVLQESILLTENTELKPFDLEAYMNKPYVFRSKEEFDKFVSDTRNENLDTLYKKIKSIWKKYIDSDDFHIAICSADTIYTYFQDKLGLTHYLFFVGGNTSGKSNNLTVFHFLAYRNMTSSDMTAANIYQFLGSREEGVGTICEDEADDIDEDLDKMRIYKNGYTTGRPVLRTDTSYGRKQFKFNTFCFKAFAAEKLPDSVRAKGFNERIIELPCVYGFPQYDISEVINDAGEEEYVGLVNELSIARRILLVYRLLHFRDKIPDIKLNIENREKQLFKPVIRSFQKTETLKELLPAISQCVSQKRIKNANTLHAFLYKLVRDLITKQNTTELESTLIWKTICDLLPGNLIPNKPMSYKSTEFGTISQKGIIETLIQIFGAKPSHNRREKRRLIFDMDKLQRLGRIYDLSIDIRVGASVTDETDVTHIGLDRHIYKSSAEPKSNTNIDNTSNPNITKNKDCEKVTPVRGYKD